MLLVSSVPKTIPNLPPKAAIMGVVNIKHFSDILCVWAYISRVRIDAIKEKYGDVVRIKHRSLLHRVRRQRPSARLRLPRGRTGTA
jgi:hypothetical protein